MLPRIVVATLSKARLTPQLRRSSGCFVLSLSMSLTYVAMYNSYKIYTKRKAANSLVIIGFMDIKMSQLKAILRQKCGSASFLEGVRNFMSLKWVLTL